MGSLTCVPRDEENMKSPLAILKCFKCWSAAPLGIQCCAFTANSSARDSVAASALAAAFLLQNQIYSCFKRLDILINCAL